MLRASISRFHLNSDINICSLSIRIILQSYIEFLLTVEYSVGSYFIHSAAPRRLLCYSHRNSHQPFPLWNQNHIYYFSSLHLNICLMLTLILEYGKGFFPLKAILLGNFCRLNFIFFIIQMQMSILKFIICFQKQIAVELLQKNIRAINFFDAFQLFYYHILIHW